ncbi:hypothetical protein [Brevundimonas sp.]|uniref:hypothetical protein n=1 Tax=Brevundimonas sp. TaxID=1871086 RepID=UPI003F7044CA
MTSWSKRAKSRAINVGARVLLTATALAPVGFTYAWVAYIQDMHKAAFIIAAVSVSLMVICLLVTGAAKASLSATDFRAQSIEAADHENTAFLLLYVMPLFTSQFRSLEWEFWVPTALIFVLITATGYNYHFNPLLGLFGWHFYKVESSEGVTFVLITKRQIRSNKESMKVGQLTEYILLDLEE